ncbi:Exoribonuclease phosphorolytic domain 1 [Trinorchestia longiramus]|nr:Exoribonuclease phosphorolytic domain 1 [Trinorchestia longiramus]
MVDINLSEAEKRYIIDGVKLGIRADGRGPLDYRELELETGVLDTANGSARVRLHRTDVLVTVKMELEPPAPARPNHGKLLFFVNYSGNAAPEFEGRGGDELAARLSGVLERLYSDANAFNTAGLVLVPGKYVKAFYVDVEVLECGGNLFDVVSVGVKAALYATRTPSITITGEDGGELEFNLSDNPYDVDRLDVVNAPVLITHLRVSEGATVVDPSIEEEQCAPVSVVVGVAPNSSICAVHLLGPGTIGPQTLQKALKGSSTLGADIHVRLLAKLKQEENFQGRRIRGFLG